MLDVDGCLLSDTDGGFSYKLTLVPSIWFFPGLFFFSSLTPCTAADRTFILYTATGIVRLTAIRQRDESIEIDDQVQTSNDYLGTDPRNNKKKYRLHHMSLGYKARAPEG